MFENFLCRTRSKDAILQIVWNWIARKRKMCIHKDIESWTIHKDRCKFKVASNSDKIPNLQHLSCTMSNFLQKSINHLSTVPDSYWRISQPIHRLLLCPLSSYSCWFFPPWKKSPLAIQFRMTLSRVDLLTSGLPHKTELTLRTSVPVEGQNYCRHKHPQQGLFLLLHFHFSMILNQHWILSICFGLKICLCTTKIRRTIEHCIASYPSCNLANKDYRDVYFYISSKFNANLK